MDFSKAIKAISKYFNIHKVGERNAQDPSTDSSASSQDLGDRPRPALGSERINGLPTEQTAIKGLNPAVLDHVMAAFDTAIAVHARDPLEGHKMADEILLQIVNVDKVREAFKKCC